MEFAAAVHDATARFPGDERFGLRMQLRRSSVSVPSNMQKVMAARVALISPGSFS
jgi:four helix bundle protein